MPIESTSVQQLVRAGSPAGQAERFCGPLTERPTDWRRPAKALRALVVACTVVVSACGGGSSPDAAVAPAITVGPSSQSVDSSGAGVDFSVSATGDALSYQWQLSLDAGATWVDIANAVEASWRIATPDASMNGQRYRVIVRSGAARITSAAVTLTVPQPSVAVQPVDVSISAGGDASFSVTATGVALRYQWQSRAQAGAAWVDVPGANAASYLLRAATAALNGYQYRVIVSSGGVVAPDSGLATLAVTPVAQAPAITVQPASTATSTGRTVTFGIVVDGIGLLYQWQRSIDAGATWVDIVAATAAAYSIDAPTADMNGFLYRVVVSNALSALTSAPARLAVSSTSLAGLPYDITVAADGMLLVTALPNVNASVNQWAGYVQRIDPTSGAVTTVAGSAIEGYVNAVGSAARFRGTENLVSDAQGNVYVGDLNNAVIRKVTPDGIVSTYAGTGSAGSVDGPRSSASFVAPRALSFDAAGNLYVVDQFAFKIRKIAPDGTVSTLAGNGLSGTSDGTGAAAQFKGPAAIGIGPDGVLYIGDTDGIRKVSPTGVVSTWTTLIKQAAGLVFDASGNLYATAWAQSQIYKITPAGVVSVFAGGAAGFADGTGTAAKFANPLELAIDAAGHIYVADTGNRAVRKISPAGVVTTVVR